MSASPKVLVVIDTNILDSERGQREREPLIVGPFGRQLLEWCAGGLLDFAIPEVVVREKRRHVQHAVRSYHQASRVPLSAIVEQSGMRYLPELDAASRTAAEEEFAERYVAALTAILDQYGGHVLPLPPVDVPLLLEREMDVRKPFSLTSNDKTTGLRDVLIWETFVTAAAALDSDDMAIFVSNNGKDFWESGNSPLLAEELRPDLTRLNVQARVKVAPDLATAQGLVQDFLGLIVQLTSAGLSPSDLAHSLASHIENEFACVDFGSAMESLVAVVEPHDRGEQSIARELGLPAGTEDLFITSAEPLTDSLNWVELESSGGGHEITGTMTARLEIEGVVHRHDVDLGAGYEVRGFNWDHNYAEVTFSRDFGISFTLNADASGDVDCVEITTVEADESDLMDSTPCDCVSRGKPHFHDSTK